MVSINLGGKEFPLCLTVACLDKINEKCGGIGKLISWLNNGDVYQNHAWLLSLMIQEGEENRIITEKINGTFEGDKLLPSTDMIMHLLTPGRFLACKLTMMRAIDQSMRQDIEAENSKNVKNAEQ